MCDIVEQLNQKCVLNNLKGIDEITEEIIKSIRNLVENGVEIEKAIDSSMEQLIRPWILQQKPYQQIARQEQRRWNAYMRAQGVIKPSKEQLEEYWRGYQSYPRC